MGLFITIIDVIIVTIIIIYSINLQYLCAYYVQSTPNIQNICDLCPNIFFKNWAIPASMLKIK